MIVFFEESIQWTGENQDEIVEWATNLLKEMSKKPRHANLHIDLFVPYFHYNSVFPNQDGVGYGVGTHLVWNDFNELDFFIPIPNDLVVEP